MMGCMQFAIDMKMNDALELTHLMPNKEECSERLSHDSLSLMHVFRFRRGFGKSLQFRLCMGQQLDGGDVQSATVNPSSTHP